LRMIRACCEPVHAHPPMYRHTRGPGLSTVILLPIKRAPVGMEADERVHRRPLTWDDASSLERATAMLSTARSGVPCQSVREPAALACDGRATAAPAPRTKASGFLRRLPFPRIQMRRFLHQKRRRAVVGDEGGSEEMTPVCGPWVWFISFWRIGIW